MISIVIPVYNGEKSIVRCLSSLQKQTLSDFEVIIINDGSTDATREKVASFIENDPRFKLYTTKNQGVAEARNVGLSYVSGEYICFVDADDYVSTTYLEDFEKEMPYDLACQGYTLVADKNYSYSLTNKSYTKEEATKALLDNRAFYSFLWNKSFKVKTIKEKHLQFQKGITYGEDLWFIYQFIGDNQVIKGIPKENYFYIRHEESVGGSLNKEKVKKRLTYLDVMILVDSDLKDSEVKDILAKKIATTGIIYLANMKNYGFSSSEIKEQREKILPYEKHFFQMSGNIKEKVKMFLFKNFPKLTRKYTEN